MEKIIFVIFMIFISCSKEKSFQPSTFDHSGKETKECSVRSADGRGPYISLGRMSERECSQNISRKCADKQFKQVHKRKGHFARGKFGSKITIGLCP